MDPTDDGTPTPEPGAARVVNRQTLLEQLAAIESLMGSLRDEPIPVHTERCLWAAMNDVADARTVLSLAQQADERRTGVVTVHHANRTHAKEEVTR